MAGIVLPGDTLAVGMEIGTIQIWNPKDGKKLRVLSATLASGSWNNSIILWDLLKRLGGHTDRVYSLSVLENGRLISGSSDRTIRIWA